MLAFVSDVPIHVKGQFLVLVSELVQLEVCGILAEVHNLDLGV